MEERDTHRASHLPTAGLAALAFGWFEGALHFLKRGLESRPPAEPPGAAGDAALPPPEPHPDPALVLLAARYGLWTADLRSISNLAEQLVAPVDRTRSLGLKALLQDLIRALEPGGASPSLQQLRDAAGVEASTGPYALQWRPTLDLLSMPNGDLRDRLTRPEAAATLLASDPTRDKGLTGMPYLPSLALVNGLLRAEADAGYGRLTLAPRLPQSWATCRMGGLWVGDASVDVDYRGTATAHRFSLRQNRGRVPLNLVFAPEVPWPEAEAGPLPGKDGPGTGDVRVKLNGTSANAEVAAAGPRVRIRMQVPLDRETEIEVSAGQTR